MRLVGTMDSPYVRRVAVALNLMGVPFEHEPVSVFRQIEAFTAINPVVKAPTLVLDDGTTIMDSTQILLFVERLVAAEHRLAPVDAAAHLRSLRASGLALSACEKTVQIIYELNLRPAEKRHQPWLDRVAGQLRAAYRLLDEVVPEGDWIAPDGPAQGDIDAAVAWRFTGENFAGQADEYLPRPDRHPRLAALSARAEALPAFCAAPFA